MQIWAHFLTAFIDDKKTNGNLLTYIRLNLGYYFISNSSIVTSYYKSYNLVTKGGYAMQINEQIKENRKNLGLTQEQVANYIGVTAPAVNKWERGITYPGITLLPALARLLKIDLNTLFSFNEELTEIEIKTFIINLIKAVQSGDLDAAFEAAVEKIHEYPLCNRLLYYVASTLDSALVLSATSPENKAKYDEQIMSWYEFAASSSEESIKNSVIFILAGKYMKSSDLLLMWKIYSIFIAQTCIETGYGKSVVELGDVLFKEVLNIRDVMNNRNYVEYDIDYRIIEANEKILSVLFTGFIKSPQKANNLAYSVTIDLNKERIMDLSEFFKIDKSFVESHLHKDFKVVENNFENLKENNPYVEEYVNNYNQNTHKHDFYINDGTLGLIIPAPQAMGYILIEGKYQN